ncbi:MAG: hypothetical protein ACYS6W_07645, partial [Planctomycetota bacterium]
LTFLVSFVFASFPLLLPGFTLLVLNYREKFQILNIYQACPRCVLTCFSAGDPGPLSNWAEMRHTILIAANCRFDASPERVEENPLPSEFTLLVLRSINEGGSLGVYPEQDRREQYNNVDIASPLD